jgi:phosphatidylserine decarboxylase
MAGLFLPSWPAAPHEDGLQVHVIGALPLKSLSRIYGSLNDWTLPTWFRVPGFKLYGFLFGVNFAEVPEPLESYKSLGDFFYRSLKPGLRHADDALLVGLAYCTCSY